MNEVPEDDENESAYDRVFESIMGEASESDVDVEELLAGLDED